ncbi:MAG: threonine/serine dehydratase [Chromatiales bacterium]|nr:threonine/serine dehydratase [Chromatiales bacterium]
MLNEQYKEYPVGLTEVIRAKSMVYRWLKPTQLIRNSGLSDHLGVEIYFKHENHNPTGSFKIRGGVNLMGHLQCGGVQGVITFSTGNHGLSVATSAVWHGIDAVVVVPENNNPAKNRKIRETGAELVEAGSTFEEAATVVEELCQQRGLYYVHPANEPHLINGVGTEFLEIIEQLPDLDAVIVPIGAGSEAAAAIVTLKTINPDIEVYAVQAVASPAAHNSWQSGVIESAPNKTFAGGFATGIAYETPFSIYQSELSDFVLLTEEEIYEGIALMAFYTQNLVEGAGGSTIGAALKLKEKLAGKRVALQVSGCNASPEEVQRAYALSAFAKGCT